MKRIDITIDTDGGVEVEAFGFKGRGCSEEIDVFANALGEKIESRKKSEFYAKEGEAVKIGWKR